jgi:hypothetical protein
MNVDHVDGASQTWIEGVDGAKKFKWALWIRDRRLDERGFVRAALTLGVSRTSIPRGGHYRLVILDRLIFDLNPVPK